MNRGEAVRVVATLSAAYPSWNAGKETVGVYVELLKDLEYEQVLEAVSDLICTEEWCPSVATVRRRVAAKKGVLAPPAVEAWDEVIDKVRQVGLRGGGAEWSHPAIKQTVRAIGWNQICQSTNVDTLRAHFLKMYQDLRSSSDNDAVRLMGRSVLEQGALPELD